MTEPEPDRLRALLDADGVALDDGDPIRWLREQ